MIYHKLIILAIAKFIVLNFITMIIKLYYQINYHNIFYYK